MRHFRSAAANVERRASELLNTERIEGDASAYNIDDGIDRANFVKMNFFERNVVHGGFGFTKFAKNGGGVFSY